VEAVIISLAWPEFILATFAVVALFLLAMSAGGSK
jgi:hypothetical protein